MRFIEKHQSPACLDTWKQQWSEEVQAGRELIWKELQNPEKGMLHESLLQEQGYLCCYCERRITRSDSHIEHLKPQSLEEYKYLRFEYFNLLASCETKIAGQPPPWTQHCGTS